MKKLLALTLCALCLFSLAACGSKDSAPEGSGSAEMTIANPFVDYDTIEDAAAAAGFDLKAPDTIAELAFRNVQVMNSSMIQANYGDPDEETNHVVLRKAEGVDDISGDYTEYELVKTVEQNGVNVTLRCEEENAVYGAIWTVDGCSYALNSELPMDEAEVLAVVDAVE